MNQFDYNQIPKGYYDQVANAGNPIRRCWHLEKFERVLECFPRSERLSILDIGCFSGTFLSLLPPERFSKQLGVDILQKQIDYANENFGTQFRSFQFIKNITDLDNIDGQFDCVTLIEVIEHLTENEVYKVLKRTREKLVPNGRLVISTPNYMSAWRILEFILNHTSDISYKEQHLTKFSYFTVIRELNRIYPGLNEDFVLNSKTTTHFITPFLGGLSIRMAQKISKLVPPHRWHFPFGNLILLVFTKTRIKGTHPYHLDYESAQI